MCIIYNKKCEKIINIGTVNYVAIQVKLNGEDYNITFI